MFFGVIENYCCVLLNIIAVGVLVLLLSVVKCYLISGYVLLRCVVVFLYWSRLCLVVRGDNALFLCFWHGGCIIEIR